MTTEVLTAATTADNSVDHKKNGDKPSVVIRNQKMMQELSDMGYEIHISHLRQFQKRNGTLVMIQKHYKMPGMSICSCGGMTVVSITNTTNSEILPHRLTEIANCADGDNFCKRTGTNIALGRLLKKLSMFTN